MDENVKPKGSMQHYLRWPFYLLIPLALGTGAAFYFNYKAGLAALCGVAVYLLVALLVSHRYSRTVTRNLVSFASSYATVEQKLLEDLEFPCGVMDLEGRLIWANQALCGITGQKSLSGRQLNSVFQELDASRLPSWEAGGMSEAEVTYGGKIYRAVLRELSLKELAEQSVLLEEAKSESTIVVLYLYDVTELKAYMKQHEDDKLAVALVYIDNYEETLQTVEDVRRSLLTALVDRKISKYFSDLDGLVSKLEKDRYLLIMRRSSLELLEESKFHILDEVKTVNIGNEIAVTLSIGVGLNGDGYLQNYEYAQTAMEMALGRGGDQAVIKDGGVISYYGGKTPQMEKNTRVKARVKAQALMEFITNRERVVVMGHKITDVDALGAAIGIYRAGKTLGKPVHIVVNDPTTSIKPLIAEFLDNPEYEPSMFVDSKEAQSMVDDDTAVVVVDTNKPSYTECAELLGMTKTILVLDHHRRGNEVIENAVLSYVEPYASSTCEMVSEILQYFPDDLKLRNIEADCLYAGIMIDTNNFTTRSGVRTFEAAAFLRRNGADIIRVRKMLRDNIDSYKARAEAVAGAEIYKGCFAIATCASEGLESPTVVGAQAANELLNIAGVKASFVLTAFHDEVYISARAIDEVNVQIMMEKLGGGGHINIAGAQVQGSMDEARTILKSVIDETASDAMEEQAH